MIFDEEDQSNEELALAEICGSQEFETIPQDLKIDFVKTFGDEISDNFKVTRAGRLKARPDLRDSELSVRYPEGEFLIKYLPPVVLEFILPDNYPSVRSPIFRIRSEWMNKSQIEKLTAKLKDLSAENAGCVLLFTWLSFLKEEVLTFLKIETFLDISEKIWERELEKLAESSSVSEEPSPISEGSKLKTSSAKKFGSILLDDADGTVLDGANGYSHPDSHPKFKVGSKRGVDLRDGDFGWGLGVRSKREEEKRRDRKREETNTHREKRTQKHSAKSSASNLANPSDEHWDDEEDLRVEDERMRREKVIRKKIQKEEKIVESPSNSCQRKSPDVNNENVFEAKQVQSESSSSHVSKEQTQEEKSGEQSQRKKHRNRRNEKTLEDESNSCEMKNKVVSKDFKQNNRKKNRSSEGKIESDKKASSQSLSQSEVSRSRQLGVIVRWIEHRGFGFIRQTGSKEEHYFHRTNFIGPLHELKKGLSVVYRVAVPAGRSSVEAVRVFPAADGAGLISSGSEWEPDWETGCKTKPVFKADSVQPKAELVREPSTPSTKSSAEIDVVKSLTVEDLTLEETNGAASLLPQPKILSNVEKESCDLEPAQVPGKRDEMAENKISDVLPSKSDTKTPTVIEKSIPSLVKYLKQFNSDEEIRNFDLAVFPCNVCFAEKMGSQSIRFPDCHHVYCKECMAGYFEVQIKEGLVSNLTCPEEKCDSQALPNQVKHLVPESLYTRYENQLLATTLETMTDVLRCPRLRCQCPTVIDREGSMGVCPKCDFAFCIYCKAAFHGVAACRMKSQEHRALMTEYMGATPDHKLLMEKRYSKKQLTTMMNQMLSENYLTDNTKNCPKCQAPIQKSEGCNKMTCNKCNTFFCYLCGKKLPLENPYSHFSLMGSDCFNQLFQGAEIDDPDFIFLEGDDDFDEFDDEDDEDADEEERGRRVEALWEEMIEGEMGD